MSDECVLNRYDVSSLSLILSTIAEIALKCQLFSPLQPKDFSIGSGGVGGGGGLRQQFPEDSGIRKGRHHKTKSEDD